jgi:hypothetical protein
VGVSRAIVRSPAAWTDAHQSRSEDDVPNGTTSGGGAGRGSSGPSAAQLLDFARRSELVNLDKATGPVLEQAASLEIGLTRPMALAWNCYVAVMDCRGE